MTPAKCAQHELRAGELADGPRYSKALVDSLSCPQCLLLGAVADERWRVVVWLRRAADELDRLSLVRSLRRGDAIRRLAEGIEHGEHLPPADPNPAIWFRTLLRKNSRKRGLRKDRK